MMELRALPQGPHAYREMEQDKVLALFIHSCSIRLLAGACNCCVSSCHILLASLSDCCSELDTTSHADEQWRAGTMSSPWKHVTGHC